MKPKLINLSLLLLLLTSCVSKKKYSALNQQHQQSLNDKVTLEDVLTKMATENDSLKNQITLLDSMLHDANLKKTTPGSPKTSVAKTKPTTISKTQEYDTKALYIYSITKYVFWPSFVKETNFLIGTIGESSLNTALASYIYGKKIHGLPVTVEPYNPTSKKFYHVIVVVENKQKEFYKNNKHLQGQPILVIEENQFLDKANAHVSIYPEGNKIKFKLNEKQIQKTGLNVSDLLIKLAENSK
ncbi:MAG TPA: YfiR family protein [Bacteroidia bacterium]|jgi:hypothetical protein|nr:YfiR family protein [Bacteroidia bacterium]